MLSQTSSAVFCKGLLSQTSLAMNSGDLLKESQDLFRPSNRHGAALKDILNQQKKVVKSKLEEEIELMKNSLEDIEKDLHELVSSRQITIAEVPSSREFPTNPSTKVMTQVSSQRSSSAASVTRNARQNIKIASISHNSVQKRASHQSIGSCCLLPVNRRQTSVIYLPLSKLVNSKFVRQIHPQQIQVFQLDKSLGIGGPKTFTFGTMIQKEPNSLIFEVFKDLSPHQTFMFYCMKGTQKGLILHRIVEVLHETVKASANVRFNIAEVLYLKCDGVPDHMDPSSTLQNLVTAMWQNINQERQRTALRIEELQVEINDSKRRYQQLKKIIRDQVQLNQNRNRQKWLEMKQTLHRNLMIEVSVEDDESSNISFLFAQNKPNQHITSQRVISDSDEYDHYMRICSETTPKTRIFCLNPQVSMHRVFNEYLAMALK